MSRSKGAPVEDDGGYIYPFQVVVKNDAAYRKGLWEISQLATKLGAQALGHHFYFAEEGAHYSVYCFPTQDSAEKFLTAYSGEWLSPADRKKENWRPRSILPGESISTTSHRPDSGLF